MLEHNYMIRKGSAGNLIAGMNWLTGAMATAEIIRNIAVPSTPVFSTPTGAEASTIEALARAMPNKRKQ